jgi:hypothetical protein
MLSWLLSAYGFHGSVKSAKGGEKNNERREVSNDDN